MIHSTTSAEFFDRKYREDTDPWNFAHSEYEQSRYRAILAALSHGKAALDDRRYERAFEPGCSVGELTWQLAQRCAHVDAMDISSTAVLHARQRSEKAHNVTFHVGALPHHIPGGAYDLIVFSEIGYYFTESGLEELANMLVQRIDTSGTLLAAHWLGSSKDHLLSGDRVHEILSDAKGLRHVFAEHHGQFRLDRWVRV